MTDDLKSRTLANRRTLSLSTARHVAGFLQHLEGEHGAGDDEVIERALSHAVRAAWAQGEPWAVEYVQAAVDHHKGGVDRALALAGQAGWDPVDTVAALPGMDCGTAAFILGRGEACPQPEDGSA